MVNIVELGPAYAEPEPPGALLVHRRGGWGTHDLVARLAGERGHRFIRPEEGPITEAQFDDLVAEADALILSPNLGGGWGQGAPGDAYAVGRVVGARVLDRLAALRPDVHVLLTSHFLAGHGINHRNRRVHAFATRAVEQQLRSGPTPWTILRNTWLSRAHDPSFQIRFDQSQYADGLVTNESLAEAAIAAIEHPEVSVGRTASVYNLSVPGAPPTDLVAEFAALRPDFEAHLVRAAVAA